MRMAMTVGGSHPGWGSDYGRHACSARRLKLQVLVHVHVWFYRVADYLEENVDHETRYVIVGLERSTRERRRRCKKIATGRSKVARCRSNSTRRL